MLELTTNECDTNLRQIKTPRLGTFAMNYDNMGDDK